MSEFLRINRPRVERIRAILALIDKSARSQRASAAERAELLDPLAELLAPAPRPENRAPAAGAADGSATGASGWQAARAAIAAMHWSQVDSLCAAIRPELRGGVITRLVDDLVDRAAGAAGREHAP